MLDNAWYIDDGDNSTTGWWGLTQWSNNGGLGSAWTAGQIIRQSGTPTVGNERIYVCVVGGTGGTTTDPLTTFTRGVVIADAAATFQEATGVAALNGDKTNTPTWAQMRAASTTASLGQVIQRNNGVSYQICTATGIVSGSEPAFSDTAGTATTDNGATWRCLGLVGVFATMFAAPHARLASAFTTNWGASGNTFFLHNTHAETQTTALTATNKGTLASPNNILSVATGGSIPPTAVTAGASISTTGASALTLAGTAACYDGITFQSGSAGSNASLVLNNSGNSYIQFRNCNLTLNNTGASSQFNLANSLESETLCTNCIFTFGSATGQSFTSGGNIADARIIGGSVVVGANVPTTLFSTTTSVLLLQAVDLSGFGTGKTIIGAAASSGVATLLDCKLGASVTPSGTPNQAFQTTYVIRSDSGNTNYNQQKYSYTGTQLVETTIVRTGGATDGTTPISWKVSPTANSKWILPYECIPIIIWNSTITPTTFTVTLFGVSTGGSVPDNATVWMDIEGLGTASFPLGTITTTTKASNLAAAGSNSSDSSTWGGGTTPFKIVSSAITMQKAGYLNIYVKVVTSAGTPTIYIDPLVVLT